MKRIVSVLFALTLVITSYYAYGQAEEVAATNPATQPKSTANVSQEALPPLVVADFNSESKPNNIGGDFGSWNYAPNDPTQGCWDAFESTDFLGGKGFSVELDYDVKSPNPAFCGFWMKLGWTDVTPYDTLSFWVKGDEAKGYTSRFKVELKNKQGARAVFTVSGVDNKWQEFNIPIKQSRSIKDWSKMDEFTIVFDDILATKKVGKIYLDQISFKKAPPQAPLPNAASAETQVSDKK